MQPPEPYRETAARLPRFVDHGSWTVRCEKCGALLDPLFVSMWRIAGSTPILHTDCPGGAHLARRDGRLCVGFETPSDDGRAGPRIVAERAPWYRRTRAARGGAVALAHVVLFVVGALLARSCVH